jgi:hypothetical protein
VHHDIGIRASWLDKPFVHWVNVTPKTSGHFIFVTPALIDIAA